MNQKTSFLKTLGKHLQSGVSYIIPLVAGSGLTMAISTIVGGQDPSGIWGILNQIGQAGLDFIVPMIAAFISYSIADKPGLAPAFIAGLVANQMETGFLGGIAAGLITGYVVKFMVDKIKVPDTLRSLKSVTIIPLLSIIIVGLFFVYVIGPPITWLTELLTSFLENVSGTNEGLLAAILGGMMAIDMGGPINKVALAFGLGGFADGAFVGLTATHLAIGLPPFGMWLATKLKPSLYEEDEEENARASLVLGIVGISEGAIPFAVKDPIGVIPGITIGTALATGINGFFSVTISAPLATFLAIPLASNILVYIISIAVGSLTIALTVNGIKTLRLRRTNET